jgi:hypothetical protein
MNGLMGVERVDCQVLLVLIEDACKLVTDGYNRLDAGSRAADIKQPGILYVVPPLDKHFDQH